MVSQRISDESLTNEEWLAASFYQMPAAWRKGAKDANGNPVGRRRYNSAYFKFTDTTFGGSDVVNPRHQYTVYADPPIKGVAAVSEGMGEWYSSTIDDNKHKIHIGPGIPAFNSMIGFFKNYYEAETGNLVNSGRGNSLSFQVGKVLANGAMIAGTGAALAATGTAGLVAVGLVAGVGYGFSLTKKMYNYLSESPSSKYYYLKPAAEMYWNAVSNIMNTLCVYTGFVERPHLPGTSRIDTSNLFYKPEDAKIFRGYMPDLFREDGSIDVYRLSRKAQILQDVSRDRLQQLFDTDGISFDTRGSSPVLVKRIRNYLNSKQKLSTGTGSVSKKYVDNLNGFDLNKAITESVDQANDADNIELNISKDDIDNLVGINEFFQSYLESQMGKLNPDVKGPQPINADGSPVASTSSEGNVENIPETQSAATPEQESAPVETGWFADVKKEITGLAQEASKDIFNGYESARDLFAQAKADAKSTADNATDFLRAQARGGADFVSYHVDYAGAAQESFGNSTTTPGILGSINDSVRNMRNTRFNLAEGNIGDGAISGAIETVVGTVTGLASGAAVAFGLDGMIAMAGKGFADIPKVWDSSSANLTRMSYTIELRAVYGHRFDIMRSILYPLATLLAFVLPRSTGKQSYSAPFLCRAFDKGRAVCRLGIMSELSITRGEGNVAWNDDLLPLAVNVSFTIEDLSSILHMPIAPMLSIGDLVTIGAGNVAGGAVGTAAAGVQALSNGTLDGTGTTIDNYQNAGKQISNLLTSGNWDDDNAFTDYMSALGSLDITDMINATNRLKLRMAQRVTAYNTQMSASYFGNQFHGTIPGKVLAAYANQGAVGG